MVDWAMLSTLAGGAVTTIWISSVGIAVGIPLGLMLALIRMVCGCLWLRNWWRSTSASFAPRRSSRSLCSSSSAYRRWGVTLSPTLAALITLSVNTSAFHAEIWRASIMDFPHAQAEAASAYGMTRWQAFRLIVLPQAWRASLPPMVNEMTFLIKSSPAIAVIGVVDLTRAASRIAAYTYDPLPPTFPPRSSMPLSFWR